MCDHIMIIAHGRLVASDTAENLTSLMACGSRTIVTVRAAQEEVKAVLAGLDGVESAEYKTADEGGTKAEILPRDGRDLREEIFFAFAAAGLPILEMKRERATLEDVFLELTQSERSAGAEQEVQSV